ncbi:MAG: glucose PTS transporter subunit IIA [Treponema sp.]|nr:glucose PTS transporter subunit IIA [Treponema sp.]
MAKDFMATAQGVLGGVGGMGNIKNVVHCATRLRFTLSDISKADDAAIKATPGVVSVVKAGGLYQVIIGNDVPEVFAELQKMGVTTGTFVGEDDGTGKAPVTAGGLVNSLINTISGIFTPILPALMGTGLIKGVLAILQIVFPQWAASGDGAFDVLYAASDALFYFLPVIVAYSASQKFGLEPILGLVIGTSLVYPRIVAMYPFGPWALKPFFGFDILVMLRYSGTVLPSIFAVYGAAKLYKHFRRTLPSAIKTFIAPFFTLIIMVPLTFLIVGPVFGIVGLGIQNGIMGIYQIGAIGAILLGAIMGGFWQVLVIFGLHWAIVPLGIQQTAVPNEFFGGLGVTTILPYAGFGACAMMGAMFGMALRMKNVERRSAGFAAGIGGIFGITEPIIYGFTLPKKRPFLLACISGATAGALAGGVASIFSGGRGLAGQMGALGIFAFPNYLLPGYDGGTANFLVYLFAYLLSVGLSFSLVYATYRPDAAELRADKATEINTSKVNVAAARKIFAPSGGRLLPLNQSADAAHQKEALGKGVCIMPLGGKIVAPFDGIVEMVFDTKHAISLKSADGVEVLIHCGIDTVKLGGKGFEPRVQEGETVKVGQLILEYDKDLIARSGYSLETQVVVTNTGDFKAVTQAKSGDCNVGDLVLYVEG